MLITSKFSKAAHFCKWERVNDLLLDVANDDKGNRVIIITLVSQDNQKLKIHLSPGDVLRVVKMMGLVRELTNLNVNG